MNSVHKITILILVSSVLLLGEKITKEDNYSFKLQDNTTSDLELTPSEIINPNKIQDLRKQQNDALFRLKRFSTKKRPEPLAKQYQPPKYPVDFHPQLSRKEWNLKQKPGFFKQGRISFFYSQRSDTIQILLNDTTNTTISRFDSVTISVIFSTGESSALIEIFLDDGDGIFDPATDFNISYSPEDEDSLYIEDNDVEDENPDVGIWEATFLPHEDEYFFFSMEGATLYISASDGGGSASAQANIEGIDSPFSVSGSVSPESANVAILAIPFWAFDHPGKDRPAVIWSTLTDTTGDYLIHLPPSDMPEGIHWFIMAVDLFDVTDGLFPEIFGEEVLLTGNITNIDFNLVPPNAWISGFIDNALTDVPINEVTVITNSGPYTATGVSGTGGDYLIGVMGYEQGWNVEVNEKELYPGYLVPFGRHADLLPGEEWEENFSLFPNDSEISGWLFSPNPEEIGDVIMFAWSKEGWSYTEVTATTSTPYTIPVSSLLDTTGGYWVVGWQIDSGDLIFIPEGLEAMSGDTDLNFTIISPNAFVNGQVSGQFGPWEGPIPGAWVQFSNDSITVTRHTNHEGLFHVPLVGEMDYEVIVFAEEFEPFFDSLYVPIGDDLWLDIFLEPMMGGGSSIEGMVLSITEEPIPDALVQAWSWDWSYDTWTDENGYFQMNVEPGRYNVKASAEGFFHQIQDAFVEFEDVVYLEFLLQPVEGTIYGVVVDEVGNPVPDAMVMADGWNYYDWPPHFETMTDDSGFYYLPVLNNTYTVSVIHEGFWIEREDSVVVEDSDVQVDFTLTEAPITGAVEGVVYFVGGHDMHENPLAWVQVWNDEYFGWTITLDDGNYHIPLPNGVYNIFAVAQEYRPFYADSAVVIEDNVIQIDIELHSVHEVIPPNLFFIHDIPHDQGRQVRIIWSPGEPGPLDHFTEYSIWRFVNESGDDFPIWDYIGSVPWHGHDVYSSVVPTLGDSTAFGIYESTFMVTAHTEYPNMFFDSNPITGYSIDNLAPHTPGGLYTDFTSEGIMSTWSPPMDEDFQYFAIYRTQGDGTEPEPFATTTDTIFHDLDIDWEAGYYEAYITAFDFNGNESDTSVHSVLYWLENDEIVNTTPTEYALYSNYPNPFNPTTTIQFDLPNDGTVMLSIYNLLGQEINTVVNRGFQAGRYHFEWNGTNQSGNLVPSGVYFYRISVNGNDFTATKKMMLLR